VAIALMQANCRYGPGTAYLYSHGLYEGDQARVDGRNATGTWLWLQPENLERHCWAAASVVAMTGDLSPVPVVTTRLPSSTFYGPPAGVHAVREGERVVVRWDRVNMTTDDDRGYLIEAKLCQDEILIGVAVQTYENHHEFTDTHGCSNASGGKLYTVDKHGYSDPVTIPWPD
jgi:uncharacterized protein YraI